MALAAWMSIKSAVVNTDGVDWFYTRTGACPATGVTDAPAAQ